MASPYYVTNPRAAKKRCPQGENGKKATARKVTGSRALFNHAFAIEQFSSAPHTVSGIVALTIAARDDVTITDEFARWVVGGRWQTTPCLLLLQDAKVKYKFSCGR